MIRLLPRSATLRLAGLVFLLQLAGGAVLIGLVWRLADRAAASSAETIAATVQDELAATFHAGTVAELIDAVDTHVREDRPRGIAVLLVNGSGQPLAGNLSAWPPSIETDGRSVALDLFRIGYPAPDRIRAVASRPRADLRLLTGIVAEDEGEIARAIGEAAGVAAMVAIALALLTAWIAARSVERRLDATVATAQAAAAGATSARLPIGGDDAFAALARTVNAMIDRTATLLEQWRGATDALAHDLQSPLTRMRAALERVSSATADATARAAADQALNEVEDLTRIIDTVLAIRHAEAGITVADLRPIDLSAMLCDLAELYEPSAEDRGFAIVTEIAADVTLLAHREMLGQAVAKLIENALLHGASPITISLSLRAETVVLSVTDAGCGIARADRAHALERFGRIERARTGPGAGLGLSFVGAVARLHRGDVVLSDAAPGLRVELVLPLAT